MKIRQKIFEIVEQANSNSIYSRIYDFGMIAVIFASITPLMFYERYSVFAIVVLYLCVRLFVAMVYC